MEKNIRMTSEVKIRVRIRFTFRVARIKNLNASIISLYITVCFALRYCETQTTSLPDI
jgi:hypothetical protein